MLNLHRYCTPALNIRTVRRGFSNAAMQGRAWYSRRSTVLRPAKVTARAAKLLNAKSQREVARNQHVTAVDAEVKERQMLVRLLLS